MINTSFLLEQSEPGAGPPMGRRVGEPCEPLLAASVGGRAAWPTARHLADKIGLPLPKDDRGAVFIKNPQDVRQSRVELSS